VNKIEHLLSCLAEECAEVSQRATKAQRFGFFEIQPGQPLTNHVRLRSEIADLFAVIEMLQDEAKDTLWPLDADVDAKKMKVKQYMAYAESQGALKV